MKTNFPIILQSSPSPKYCLRLLRLTFPFVILKLAILTSVLIRECLKTAIGNNRYCLLVRYLATTPRSQPLRLKRSTSQSPERFDRSLILSLRVFALNAILSAIRSPIFQLFHPILHPSPHTVATLKSDAQKWTIYIPPTSYGLQSANYSIISSSFKTKASLGTILSTVTFAKTSSPHQNSRCSTHSLGRTKHPNTAWHLR